MPKPGKRPRIMAVLENTGWDLQASSLAQGLRYSGCDIILRSMSKRWQGRVDNNAHLVGQRGNESEGKNTSRYGCVRDRRGFRAGANGLCEKSHINCLNSPTPLLSLPLHSLAVRLAARRLVYTYSFFYLLSPPMSSESMLSDDDRPLASSPNGHVNNGKTISSDDDDDLPLVSSATFLIPLKSTNLHLFVCSSLSQVDLSVRIRNESV